MSQNPQWYKLLHFKNNQSEIDDKRFFLSHEGKTNPYTELKASIKKLLTDESDNESSTFCRYPSRSTWILENFPELKRKIKQPKCTKLQEEIQGLSTKYVSLIFAEPTMNSPASSFGHLFLRISPEKNSSKDAYAINYSAKSSNDNPLTFFYKGIFGGYEGQYSLSPYKERFIVYTQKEKRNIREYHLRLSKKEVKRLMLHFFELRSFYADYFFLWENCSYNLLWLLDIAKENTNLVDKFSYKAIPIDILRAISAENLVISQTYIASEANQSKKITSPKDTHLTTFLSLSAFKHGKTQVNIKTAYHDIYDNETNFNSGAYINILDAVLEYENKKLNIEELTLLEMKSYNLQMKDNTPISWEVTLGAKRIFNNKLNSYFKTGAGITLGTNTFFSYTTITPTTYFREHLEQSIALNTGVIYNPSSKVKFGLLYENEWFNKHREIKKRESFVTYNINHISAIHLKYEENNFNGLKERDSSLSWFSYF